MFKLLCVCIFVAQYANCLTDDDFKYFHQWKNSTSTIKPSKSEETNSPNEENTITPGLLNNWKKFMTDVRMHKKSLMTIPENLKLYILDMKSPKEFVNLIIHGMEPPFNASLPEPTKEALDGWKEFLDSLKEEVPPQEAIDHIVLYSSMMTYIRSISPNQNYRYEVNNVFQIDPALKTELNLFKNKMNKDYNVSISSLPLNLIKSLFGKFLNVKEGFISILSSEFGNHDIKSDLTDTLIWLKWLEIFGPQQSDIHYAIKAITKYTTKDTILEPQIDEIFKLHESNRLISKIEKLWKKTKEESEVHDGLEIFIKFLEELGKMYSNTEELCEERFWLAAAVVSMKNGFAPKSKCSYKDLIAKASQLEEPNRQKEDFLDNLAQIENNQTTLYEIKEDEIYTNINQMWKAFMNTLRLHNGSLKTMPEILKAYILEMTNPKEFVKLIFEGLGMKNTIREPTTYELDSWRLFQKSLNETASPEDPQIDDILIDPTLMKYIRNASDSTHYKQEVNNIFQIDPQFKLELDLFKNKMKKDYNVSISSLPRNIVMSLFMKFSDPVEGFTAILSSFPGNHQLKVQPDLDDTALLWATIARTFGPLQKDIDPRLVLLIKMVIKDSFLESKVNEVLKLHESNRLISKIEKLWIKNKVELKVHDGIQVFVSFSEDLGNMYSNTGELCNERLRIMEALDKLKDGFASRSTCAYKKLLEKYEKKKE